MLAQEKLSISKQKKLDRKLAKLQHVLKKETGIENSPAAKRNLAICNAGLVSGLTEEILFEHFSKHGTLTDIRLLPGKSCSFVSYDNIESAVNAYNSFNGKLNIAQDNKAIYLLYVSEIPASCDVKEWGQLPDGLILFENFVTTSQEGDLLNLCDFVNQTSGIMKHRLVKHFGYEFLYNINNVDNDTPLNEPVPTETDFLWPKLARMQPKFESFKPDQLTINHYSPGQGIPHHVDTHSAFEDPIICLSLGAPIVMEFHNVHERICIFLPQRSLLVMSGESRYQWTHGIVPKKFDVIKNKSSAGFTCLKRGTRVSFTFRKVLTGNCNCSYKSMCDSFKTDIPIKDDIAPQLEDLHVHKVYDHIAEHFSDTRHKPWPNVLEFVQSFSCGDVLVDIGCGNGKYLGNNSHIYEIGCDRSSGLIEVCRERRFEAFIGDCLSIPIKDSYADGVISIAVIHHLANDARRSRAIREMTRILNVGGKGLIYVWAQDQTQDEKKSSYILQDRKNRKETARDEHISTGPKDVPLPNGNISLPVHTNRSNFQAKDVLVPWKLKGENKTTFLRFYHVFEEKELDNVCTQIPNIEIVKSYYDQGNWCVIFRKIAPS